jgi:hypothetical protein
MRRLAACLLLLALAAAALVPGAQAQAPDPAAISLPVPWQAGMVLRYRSTSVTDKTRGQLHTRIQIQDVSELKILEANAQGYVQSWRSLKPEVATTGDGDQVVAEKKMATALVKRFENLPLEAQLDAQGNYTGLRNWEALGAAMREVMLPVMLEQASARKDLKKVDPELLRKRLEPALARMTSQGALDAALGRQVAIYNYFIAPSLVPHKIVTYNDDIPSPWSADIIPSKGNFELTAVDEKAGTVTVHWKQGIDPARGLDVAWKMVESITGMKKGDYDFRKMPTGLELSDEATVVLERATGIPLRIEHKRHLALGGSSTDTRWTFERLPDAGRR